jgi:hypothetical protein
VRKVVIVDWVIQKGGTIRMNCFIDYVCDAIELANSKPGTALALACILVDASAEKHFKKKHGRTGGNKEMYKEFVKDHQSIILGVGKIKFIVQGDITINDSLFEDIIYSDIRCALLHDAEQMIIISEGITGVQGNTIHFDDIIRGLVYACVLAECNNDIKSSTEKVILLNEKPQRLDEIWGRIDLFWSTLDEFTRTE